MNEKESLELITKMINTAKSQIDKSSAVYFLLWGYLVVMASLLQYVLCVIFNLWAIGHYAWLLMFVGVFVTIYYRINLNRKKRITTYIGRVIGYLWLAFGISMGILVISSVNFTYYTPVILLFVALGIFVTGIASKFKPFIWGAVICWVCAAITFRVHGIEQLLINAFALTAGYIIPGHIIYKQKNV